MLENASSIFDEVVPVSVSQRIIGNILKEFRLDEEGKRLAIITDKGVEVLVVERDSVWFTGFAAIYCNDCIGKKITNVEKIIHWGVECGIQITCEGPSYCRIEYEGVIHIPNYDNWKVITSDCEYLDPSS